MDFGDYVTEKVAAADRRGLISRLGIALTRLGRWLARDRDPVRNGRVRTARVR